MTQRQRKAHFMHSVVLRSLHQAKVHSKTATNEMEFIYYSERYLYFLDVFSKAFGIRESILVKYSDNYKMF